MNLKHVNEIKEGDTIIVRFGELENHCTITAVEITGKGYVKLYGHFNDEPDNNTLLTDYNGFVEIPGNSKDTGFEILAYAYTLNDLAAWNYQSKVITFKNKQSAKEFKKSYPDWMVQYQIGIQ